MKYKVIVMLSSIMVAAFLFLGFGVLTYVDNPEPAVGMGPFYGGSIITRVSQIKRVESQVDEIIQRPGTVSGIYRASSIRDADTANQLGKHIDTWSTHYQVDPLLVISMISVESTFNPSASSYLGAKYGRGLLQVSEVVLRDFNRYMGHSYSPSDLYDIGINLEVGIWAFLRNEVYLSRMGFDPDLVMLISSYNTGVGHYKKSGENWGYVSKVLDAYSQVLGEDL